MSAELDNSESGPTENDLKVLIGVVAYVQGALLVDDSAEVMPKLLTRLRNDLRSVGLTVSDDRGEVSEAVAGMNRRLRIAIGESGSPQGD